MSDSSTRSGGTDGAALARCIACPPDVFATDNWGRTALLTRAAELSRGFDDLLSADAVDELASRRGLRTPFARMAKDGTVLPTARYTRGGGAGAAIGDQLADDRVLAVLDDGGTLVLQALHRSWPPLAEFAAHLAAELGHPVQVNAYVTPPQNQGFAAHYDVHDVFVLQVAGRKRWTIHPPVVDSPLANQPWDARKDEVARATAGEPLIDTVLEPGDALYLPRGTIHAAAALGETSIHITVGVHPITRHQLARHLLDAAQDDPTLRASLPMGVDLADPDVLAPHLVATVAALTETLGRRDDTDAARRVGADLMARTRPVALGPLAQLDAAHELGPDDAVRLRPALRMRVETADRQVRLVLLDKTVALPDVTLEAVKTVTAGAAFTAGELPGLDVDAALTVIARLLREGIVVPA